MNILEMEAGPEMDALVAEKVMGWVRISESEDVLIRGQRDDYETGGVIVLYGNHFVVRAGGRSRKWNPSTDISAAYEMEERIYRMERVGMVARYMDCLLQVVRSSGFLLVHATPEQRCKAALLAMEGIQE